MCIVTSSPNQYTHITHRQHRRCLPQPPVLCSHAPIKRRHHTSIPQHFSLPSPPRVHNPTPPLPHSCPTLLSNEPLLSLPVHPALWTSIRCSSYQQHHIKQSQQQQHHLPTPHSSRCGSQPRLHPRTHTPSCDGHRTTHNALIISAEGVGCACSCRCACRCVCGSGVCCLFACICACVCAINRTTHNAHIISATCFGCSCWCACRRACGTGVYFQCVFTCSCVCALLIVIL